ncbi:hypothetical protein [Falsirhodobacter xinxiangensis]|uniref:hypothetical protein n=1 Tax=Falsirhodobacter xinxiangensis TaxID=2530049 RepID=UPI001FECB93D|nr:hypothetical protein [Rhodobacter xinxiangensis]
MKAFATALAVLIAPTFANASTISVGDNYGNAFTLTTGGYVSYAFTASEALTVSEIAVAGTGFSNAGLDSVQFGRVRTGVIHSFDMIESGSDPDTWAAIGFIEGFTLDVGETFSLFFEKNWGFFDANMAISFATIEIEAPAPVPLPAAGGLLAIALAGLGVAAARKKRAA